MTNSNTSRRLGVYAHLINQYGPDSEEARDFLDSQAGDEEFQALAKTASWLKRTLAGHAHPKPPAHVRALRDAIADFQEGLAPSQQEEFGKILADLSRGIMRAAADGAARALRTMDLGGSHE